jgi:hypothetical protein
MRAAPPALARLSRGGVERGLVVLAYAGTAGVLAFWAQAHWAPGAAMPVVSSVTAASALAAAVLGAWAARHWLPGRWMVLCWTGQAWQLRCADGPLVEDALVLEQLDLAIDTGGWLLLRWHASAGVSGWAVATARAAGVAAWHGLRVALAAHAGAGGVSAVAAGR